MNIGYIAVLVQDRPGDKADPGVHEVGEHQHQAGGRGPRHGARHAGLPAGREGKGGRFVMIDLIFGFKILYFLYRQ